MIFAIDLFHVEIRVYTCYYTIVSGGSSYANDV